MTSDCPLSLDKPFSLSKIIASMPFPSSGEVATVSDFVESMDRLAFSVAIFFFAALNVIPAPPGASLFLGIPLVILALQKVFGFPFWLPNFIMRASVSRSRYRSVRESLLKGVRRIEQQVKPRGSWAQKAVPSQILDITVVVLSLCVLIPLPFTAILPALSICIITLGRMEQDAYCITAGLVLGAISATLCATMIYGSGKLFLLIFGL
jgi:hypothetical protein